MNNLHGLPYPRTYKALIGKRGVNPYFPNEYFQTFGDKKEQLERTQKEWKNHNVSQSRAFTLKRISL